MTEVWKDIIDYENYQISNLGNVRSIDRVTADKNGILYKRLGVELNPIYNRNGYIEVTLYKSNKPHRLRVHRLVYSMFNGELDNTLVIDHIDGNKHNNKNTNLRQITSRLNISRSKQSKSGYTGVTKCKSGKFRARYSKNGKYKTIGLYDTAELAYEAYLQTVSNL